MLPAMATKAHHQATRGAPLLGGTNDHHMLVI